MRAALIAVCVCSVGLCLGSCSAPDQHTTKNQAALPSVSETPIAAFHVAYEHDGLTVYSGGEPSSDGSLEFLKSLGVTTVISVDATTPEADSIESLGMRSVHVPMSYSGVPTDCQSAVAKAIRESEGAVFIHCHHGLHRGPTAAAAALIALGYFEPADGLAFMRQVGTSESYIGLYQDISEATRLGKEVIDNAELVRSQEAEGLAVQMAEADRIFSNLELLAANEWHAPSDHPDLHAPSEAGRMTDLFRAIRNRPLPTVNYPSEISDPMTELEFRYASTLFMAQQVEDAIDANESARASTFLEELGNSCTQCHVDYR